MAWYHWCTAHTAHTKVRTTQRETQETPAERSRMQSAGGSWLCESAFQVDREAGCAVFNMTLFMSLSLFPFIPISDLWYLGTPRYSPWDSSMLICQICQVNLRWWIWYAVWSRRVWACKMPSAYQLAPGPGGILEQRPDGNVARPRNWKRSCARTRTQSDQLGTVARFLKVLPYAAFLWKIWS